MKNKKNPKLDLRKRSLLFFQIGLILVLFCSWTALNWKTYEKEKLQIESLSMNDFEDIEVPITKVKTETPPLLPLKSPEKIKAVDNHLDIVESLIKPTEAIPDPIPEIKDIVEVDKEDPIGDVPFKVVESAPIFPGCESLSSSERKTCMRNSIKEFIDDEFNKNLGAELGLTGINTIYIQFRIGENGEISVLGVRGPHPILEEEARRVIKALPTMEPGKQRGKPVGVSYSIPIVFKVQ